jgi:hypothetical protein
MNNHDTSTFEKNDHTRDDAIALSPLTPEVTPEIRRLLLALDGEMARRVIQAKLKLQDEKHFRVAYIQTALKMGLVEMTIPDKPNSRLQKYRLTESGRQYRRNAS